MLQSIKRNLKFNILNINKFNIFYLMYIISFLTILALIIEFIPQSSNKIDIASTILQQLLIQSIIFTFMWSLICFAIIQKLYIPLAISFCSTRISNFISNQVLKFIFTIEILSICILSNYIMPVFYNNIGVFKVIFNAEELIILFLLLLVICTLGEFLGNIYNKYNIIIAVISIISVIGILTVVLLYVVINYASSNFSTILITEFLYPNILFIDLGLIIFFLILSYINWIMFRSFVIRR